VEILPELFGKLDLGGALIIIFNLILIESLLSVDNAAVLATMVMDLPPHQRGKALRYGILGAYFFRGLSLLFVSVLLHLIFLKLLGGLYLLWLALKYFYSKSTPQTKDDILAKSENRIYKATIGKLGIFWSTVVLIEFMDLSFSIDNVFAAVAFTDNIYLICTGVFIGILAMRFAAQGFVKLMSKFPFLESLAFIVIFILGLKLVLSYACEFFPDSSLCIFLSGHYADLVFSVITAFIFIFPVLTSLAFNYPKREITRYEPEERSP